LAYTTRLEIQADFKDAVFNATSLVRSADVDQFIVESDALINSYVGKVYTVPVVVAGAGKDLLKFLSRSLVAARIKRILEVKQEKNTDPNQNIVGVLLAPNVVMGILRDIQKQNIALEGATPLTSGGGFYSSNVSNSVEPVIKKDEKQW
jgi:hypothetical protein